ncbi:hypothetical protein ACN28G_22705 [Micromonospora sp. WMMA1923]|uniref:hypothetical protein n=1 Tax=Micromonospora sp. WMMA1923 TaxID=3404125 RepID=UPI003B95CE7A
MSYPDRNQQDFPIHEPRTPQTTRGMVRDHGVDAVRQNLLPADRQAFDEANPRNEALRAAQDVREHRRELERHDARTMADLPRNATEEQVRAVREAAAPSRGYTEEDLAEVQQVVRSYRNNLIEHVDNRNLLPGVITRSQLYSTPAPSVADVAPLQSPGGSRSNQQPRSGHSDSSPRPPLGESRGDRLQARPPSR